MSSDRELLQDIHEQSVRNGQKLEEIENRVNSQNKEINSQAERIQWNRDHINWIYGAAIIVSALITLATGLSGFGVI